jgi:hypothetical protein
MHMEINSTRPLSASVRRHWLSFVLVILGCAQTCGVPLVCAESSNWTAFALSHSRPTDSDRGVAVIQNAPELSGEYCVARGYVSEGRRDFVAATEARKAASGDYSCSKKDFPDSYFFVQKGIEVNKALGLLAELKAWLSRATRKEQISGSTLSGEDMRFMERSTLRQVEHFPLNPQPWSFLYCARGSLFDYGSCKSLSLSVTDAGHIVSVSANDVLD